MTPDKVEAALGVLREAVDRISDNEAAPYDEALSVLTEALAERGSAIKKALLHIAAVGYPVNEVGQYDKDGDWTFAKALPHAPDAEEVKAAFLILQDAAMKETP